MRFTIAVISSFVGFVLASTDPDPNFDGIFKPSAGETIPAGTTYTVEWTLQEKTPLGPVTIELVGGKDAGGLTKISTLATGVDNAAKKFEWKVDAKLGDKAAYGLKIFLESNPDVNWQWSPGFKIAGSAVDTTTSSTASTTTTTTAVTTPSTGPAGNLTIQTSTTPAPQPSGSGGGTPTTSTGSTGSTPLSTAAGARATAGALALVGGLAVAMLGL